MVGPQAPEGGARVDWSSTDDSVIDSDGDVVPAGSRIAGATKERADAPVANAIPWLLLTAKSVESAMKVLIAESGLSVAANATESCGTSAIRLRSSRGSASPMATPSNEITPEAGS